MKILFVLPSVERFSPEDGGAIATVTYEVAKELVDLGHSVTIISPRGAGVPYSEFPLIEVDFDDRKVQAVIRRLIGAQRRLRRFDFHMYGLYLHRLKKAIYSADTAFDIVVCHNDLYAVKYLSRWLRIPVILWMHNEANTKARKPRELFGAASHIIAVSSFVKNSLREQFDIDEDRIAVALNGVRSETFGVSLERHPPIINMVSPLSILFIGRLVADKGADLLLDACILLRDQGVHLKVSIIGSAWWWGENGTEDRYFLEEIKPKLDGANAHWSPHVDRSHVPGLYAQHDLTVVPSRFDDPCPLVLLEALASGCGVIAADVGGIAEEAGDGALMFKPESIESLADVILALVEDPKRLANLQIAGRARAAELTWRRNALIVNNAMSQHAGSEI